MAWIYKRKGLPVKVIAEFDVWRKVEDHEGVTGWIHGQLVSARRTALVNEPVSKALSARKQKVRLWLLRRCLVDCNIAVKPWCRLSNEKSAWLDPKICNLGGLRW